MRRGSFKASREVVRQQPNEIQMVLRDAIIHRVEYLAAIDAYEYHIEHPAFDEVKEGYNIPEYRAVFEKVNDFIYFRWEKVQS